MYVDTFYNDLLLLSSALGLFNVPNPLTLMYAFPNWRHNLLSRAGLSHYVCNISKLSRHVVFGRPRIRLCARGVNFVNLVVHLLSSIMTICPDHDHLDLLISYIISLTPVWFLIRIQSFYCSIGCWALLSHGLVALLFAYDFVTVGSMHWLYTFLFNTTDMFDSKMEPAQGVITQHHI